MENPNDSALAQLQADWPRWQIWLVPGSPGYGPTWCARRWADVDAVPAKVLNAHTAAELADALEEASS